MEELELDYQSTHGYRPSQADKQGHKQMRRLMSEQSEVKRQIRSFRDASSSPASTSSKAGSASPDRMATDPPIGARRRDSVSSTTTEEDVIEEEQVQGENYYLYNIEE